MKLSEIKDGMAVEIYNHEGEVFVRKGDFFTNACEEYSRFPSSRDYKWFMVKEFDEDTLTTHTIKEIMAVYDKPENVDLDDKDELTKYCNNDYLYQAPIWTRQTSYIYRHPRRILHQVYIEIEHGTWGKREYPIYVETRCGAIYEYIGENPYTGEQRFVFDDNASYYNRRGAFHLRDSRLNFLPNYLYMSDFRHDNSHKTNRDLNIVRIYKKVAGLRDDKCLWSSRAWSNFIEYNRFDKEKICTTVCTVRRVEGLTYDKNYVVKDIGLLDYYVINDEGEFKAYPKDYFYDTEIGL